MKNVPCADCGGRFAPECMDFDHVRGEKIKDVATLFNSRVSYGRIQTEIAKCEVVCANCHRLRTLNRIRSRAA